MNTKEIFAQRVIELRKEKGINQAQLAERVGVSKTSANLYESATRVPDIQVLTRYAKELEVSADYLIGLSNNRTAETAAIGDKLGLSDEAIKTLENLVYYEKKMTAAREGIAKLLSKSLSREFTEFEPEHRLKTINLIISNPQLIDRLTAYLFSKRDNIAGWINPRFKKRLPLSLKDVPEETIWSELEEASNAINLYRVQAALENLQKECKENNKYSYFLSCGECEELSNHNMEDPDNVEEDQCEE